MTGWIEENRGRIGFGLQPVPRPGSPDSAEQIQIAGRLAEELGYDAFFLADHPAYAPECWLHLAALAATTTRIRLGSIVNCALYRHPVMTARLASDLDNISNGRVLLGLGAGWNATEFAQLGIPFPSVAERMEALEEAIQIVRGVLGPEPYTFEGRHFRTAGTRILPGPRQQPAIPLIIAGGGERRTLPLVARYADAANFGAGDNTGGARTSADVARKFATLRRACEDEGRPYERVLRTHFTAWIFVAPDDALAQAKLNRFYPQGLTDVQRLTRVVGDPEQVARYYQGLIDQGFEYFVVQTQDATDLESIRLLATEVIPRLRTQA